MSSIRTIGQFLAKTHSSYRVFDLGRRVVKISQSDFARFEDGTLVYPQPVQQQAWMAILGWNAQNVEDRFVWFLKFPLDETGQLVLAARDDFLARLLETVGRRMVNGGNTQELGDSMSESAYGFKPREETMAVFHAKALKILKLPPSRYYLHARDYFAGNAGYDQWAFVGIQGIADVAARIAEDGNKALLVKAIPQLPAKPFSILCHCLENEEVDADIADPLLRYMRREALKQEPDFSVIASGIRGLSYAKSTGLRREFLVEILGGPHGTNIEILAAIAGRSWEDLRDSEVCRAYVNALACNTLGQEGFNQVMAELLYMPGMRTPLLHALRDPQRSAELTAAVDGMFRQ